MSLQSLGLSEPVLRAIVDEGYTEPSPIQAQAIPHVLAGRDLFGCAQTGTGKTAAFALPILHALDTQRRRATPRAPRALILSPTRELASQIGRSFAVYGQNVHFRQTVVYGGVSQIPQCRSLSKGTHVLIATPGRLLDLINQKQLTLAELEVFVLDEADRMLDMGFLPDLKRIISQLPAKRQSLFFSATCPPNIADLAAGLLRDPVRVEITPPATTVERITQSVMFVSKEKKKELLQHVLDDVQFDRMLVFTRTKHGADKVARQLERRGVHADAIHGDKSQAARERTLAKFRAGRLSVLVATDVAARGIDIDGITHVINFDLPREPDSYVHRIGRTGRAGAEGTALSFCDESEVGALRAIEHAVKRKIPIDLEHPFHEEMPVFEPRGKKKFGGPRGKFGGGSKFNGTSKFRGKSYSRPGARDGGSSNSGPRSAGKPGFGKKRFSRSNNGSTIPAGSPQANAPVTRPVATDRPAAAAARPAHGEATGGQGKTYVPKQYAGKPYAGKPSGKSAGKPYGAKSAGKPYGKSAGGERKAGSAAGHSSAGAAGYKAGHAAGGKPAARGPWKKKKAFAAR